MDNIEMNKRTDNHYGSYENAYHTQATINSQPLPGQPPLPPMPPPPPGALPPMPMFSAAMPHQACHQMTQLQAWPHANPWQWIASQQQAAQAAREANNILKSTRGHYVRRDKFNHHNRGVYPQRGGHFQRGKNRRRFESQQQQQPGQLEHNAAGGFWQKPGGQTTDNGTGQNITNNVSTNAEKTETGDQEVRIVSEVPVKKAKQKKPLSETAMTRWNYEDAVKALAVENEHNRRIRAKSLIIKFPDPDLNKDIVREFHQGIQNIHFQSPSGPRYCFVQMGEDVDIEKAIEDLEKIPFGLGHLKVERKSLRDEDFPKPQDIDPYTLYIGNLPDSVNVNDVKNQFPKATRVDVGFAQKMRNTRYAFIRYATVDESIEAYKQVHDLMWGTRSIIARFRRGNGHANLPGEKRTDKNTNKINNGNAGEDKNETKTTAGDVKDSAEKQSSKIENDKENTKEIEERTCVPASISHQQNQPWTLKSPQQASAAEQIPNSEQMTEIRVKEEPQDYEEMEEPYTPVPDDDDSDDENDETDMDDINNDMDDNDIEPDDENDDSSPNLQNSGVNGSEQDGNGGTSDNLDQMFSALTNCGDIEL